MIPYKPNKLFVTTKLKEALAFSEEHFKFDKATVPASQIHLNEKGELFIQAQPFKISKSGISNFCSTLKIPDPFADIIPTDLLITNINRLLKEKGENLLNVYADEADLIVDINEQLKYSNIPSQHLLSLLKIEKEDVHRFKFENHLLLTEIGMKQFEFMPDSHLQMLGYAISHYPTLHHATIGQPMIWTNICSNGCLFGFSENILKLRIRSSNVLEKNINTFLSKIIPNYPVDKFEEMFVDMSNTKITAKDAKKYLNSMRNFEIPEYDSILLENKYSKSDVNTLVKEDEDQFLELNYYQLYYNLTDLGSNYVKGAIDSQKINKLAGKLILDYMRN